MFDELFSHNCVRRFRGDASWPAKSWRWLSEVERASHRRLKAIVAVSSQRHSRSVATTKAPIIASV
jgi:hypothetical protein